MKKRNNVDDSYTQRGPQRKMYVLRIGGFWGTLGASIALLLLLLLLPLVMAFFLFFIAGLVAVALIGSGYAWWHVKKLRWMDVPYEEDTIELAASEYHALEEPREKARDPEVGK